MPVAIYDTSMCIGSAVALSSELSGGTWSNGDPNIATIDTSKNAVTGVSAGSTVLTYYQPYGCTEITNVMVDDCRDVVIHDVITPNGDGINDAWVIEGLQYYPHNSVQLYDKLGDKVFDRVGYSNDWKGGSLPDGTYYYLVRLNAPNLHGSKNVWTGSLLIKR